MTTIGTTRSKGFRRFILVLGAAGLPACGGGGGDGNGFDAILISIGFGGGTVPLWQGSPAVPPQCPAQILINAPIIFTFGGPVDLQSLPPIGPALGSINISRAVGSSMEAAFGGFVVEDDPSLPSGNARRVRFMPAASADPAAPFAGGFAPGATYSVHVPRAGTSASVVTVAGQALQTEALTCFSTCNPATAPICLVDYVPGPPFVVMTTPATGDPGPPPLSPSAIASNTVTILTSEPLFPADINLQTVRLVNSATTAQMPGTVVFYQAGTPEAGARGSRIDYVAAGPLLGGVIYELLLSPAIRDFSGNAIRLWEPGSPAAPPSGRRLFSTITVPSCAQPAIVEDFSTTANLGSVTGGVLWTGTGALTADLPPDLVGNGAFGPLSFGSGPSTLDTGQPAIIAGGQMAFENGTWNATDFSVAAGAAVRCIGPYRVHVRCRGTVTISGGLNGSAGISLTAPIGDPEQGPRPGLPDNGFPAGPSWVPGGVGNAGAGGGGKASQADIIGPALRTPRGEDGFGPTINGQINTGPSGQNVHYGGGQGGVGGFFVSPIGGQTGEVGGLGAAGGSSMTSGRNGGPNSAIPKCTPVPTPLQTRALASGPPPVFATPVSIASAGSGGGGGGDKFETSGVNADDQGGGGGGGGGGLRITSFGELQLNSGTNLSMNGAGGAMGSVFSGGHGGGGSGGEIWLQSFGQVVISSTANLGVDRGSVANECGNQAAGAGGIGLFQLEDLDGAINTNFHAVPAGGSNIVTLTFPFGTQITGTAISRFLDSGYGNPVWTSATEFSDPGTIAGGTISITYQGAREALSAGLPDPATLTPPVNAAQIGQLTGYRYIRFTAVLAFPTPAAPFITGIPPSVDEIRLTFSAPINCP